MSAPLVFALPGNEPFAQRLGDALGGRGGAMDLHRFPDGETLVRVDSPVAGTAAVIAATLFRPDDKLLPLLFLAKTLKDLGAARVVLAAPYLCYLRQDKRFHEGEGVTSRYFAALLSAHVDGLVTVDPHLHRYKSLDEIYTIPSRVIHAAPAIADWVREEVTNPLLIGPDEESEQWVGDIAARVGCPHVVLQKTRRGDRDVSVSVPHVERHGDRTPVLADDIISTGRTMMAAAARLWDEGLAAPVCVGVHGLFAGDAHDGLLRAGAARVVTTDTVPHATNGISVVGPVAQAVRALL